MAIPKAVEFVAYSKAALGGGYVWGAEGEMCSPAKRQEWAERTRDKNTGQITQPNILGICVKWDGKRCWDCSGLYRGFMKSVGQAKSGGATTIWKTWCAGLAQGVISTIPKDVPGIAVFVGNGASMSHIGVSVGDGTVIEARGSAYGVVQRPLSAGNWTHWGYIGVFDYGKDSVRQADDDALDDALDSAPPIVWTGTVKTTKGQGINIWSTPTKSARVASVPEGAVVGVHAQDTTGFQLGSYEGYYGWVDAQYLLKAKDTPTPAAQAPVSPTNSLHDKLMAEIGEAVTRALSA